jgi:hypothetical protein
MRKVLLLTLLFPAVVASASFGPFQPGQVERFLLPITARNAPGAYGSVWSTELWAFAEPGKEVYFEPFFPACNPPCEDFNDRNEVFGIPSGNSFQAGMLSTKPGETAGGFVYVPSDNLEDVQFSLQLHELTGLAQTIQLPVVRQSAFSGTAVRILGVPSDSFNRATLRIYGSDPDVSGLVRVRVYSEPDRKLKTDTTYALVATQRFYKTRYVQSIATKPPAVEVGNVTADVNAPTVWIEVVPLTTNLSIWAFVSVTDNRTQEVVLRTPDTH